jgi:uncharacterized protein YqjF (DUF2071 family)
MRQRWFHLGFLHWAVDPTLLAPLLPPGLQVDTWQGKAYVGVVPFTVRGTRPPFMPPVPWLSSFHEVNLRTYVHRRGHDPGVWFFSLDASSWLTVWGARAVYKLPYFRATIALERSHGGAISFSSRRNGSGASPRFACSYEPAGPSGEARPGTLEFFLIERYLLYSWDGSRLRSARVAHAPYQCAPARILDLAQDLTGSIGVPFDHHEPTLVHYADQVDVRIYAPSRVRERAAERLRAPFGPADAVEPALPFAR